MAKNADAPGRSSDQQSNDTVFTPQMRLIHERRQQNSKSTAASSKKNRRDRQDTNDECKQNNNQTKNDLKQDVASYHSPGIYDCTNYRYYDHAIIYRTNNAIEKNYLCT